MGAIFTHTTTGLTILVSFRNFLSHLSFIYFQNLVSFFYFFKINSLFLPGGIFKFRESYTARGLRWIVSFYGFTMSLYILGQLMGTACLTCYLKLSSLAPLPSQPLNRFESPS